MFYIKAFHIIFIVTWFSGMFYLVRLFIYNTEANAKPEPQRTILQDQYRVMIRRLLLGITLPSALLTLVFGTLTLIEFGYLSSGIPLWLWVKIGFVVGLYGYQFTLARIYAQQMRGEFRYSAYALRIWNEVATILLVVIVFLVEVRSALNVLWSLVALLLLIAGLVLATRIYRSYRSRNTKEEKSSRLPPDLHDH